MQSNQKVEKESESARDKVNNEEFIEDSIEQLNKYLSDLKKDRQRTEKDEVRSITYLEHHCFRKAINAIRF